MRKWTGVWGVVGVLWVTLMPGVAMGQGTDAESRYREARQALNRSQFEVAASLFERVRSDFPQSEYVADSFYYQGFALYRLGSSPRLRAARELLRQQAERHPDAATREDGEALLVRISGELARTGDTDARASVTGRAAQPCDDEEQELKSMALSALMNMDEERAVPILRGVLENQNECSQELRSEAVFILSQKMSDDVVPLMVQLAIDDPDPSSEVREAAVFALSQTQDPRAEDALERILTTSDDREVQEQALFALSQRSSDRARRVLRDYAASDSVDPDLRETAIFWVGQGEAPESFDFLNQIFESTQDSDVKESVVFAITQTNDPRLAAWLLARVRDSSEDMEARERALFWYGQASEGDVDVAELLGLYQEVGDPELKEAVLFGLSQRLDEDAALEALIEIARTEEDSEVVENALFWLGQSEDPRAVEFLLEIIRR